MRGLSAWFYGTLSSFLSSRNEIRMIYQINLVLNITAHRIACAQTFGPLGRRGKKETQVDPKSALRLHKGRLID